MMMTMIKGLIEKNCKKNLAVQTSESHEGSPMGGMGSMVERISGKRWVFSLEWKRVENDP